MRLSNSLYESRIRKSIRKSDVGFCWDLTFVTYPTFVSLAIRLFRNESLAVRLFRNESIFFRLSETKVRYESQIPKLKYFCIGGNESRYESRIRKSNKQTADRRLHRLTMEALMRHIEETQVAATESFDEELMRMLLSPSSNAEFEEATAHPAIQMAVELAIKELLSRRQALRVGGIRRQYPERREKPKYWESPTGRQWRKWQAEADANEGCLGKKSAKDFRNRYRVPYEKAVEIISDCRDKYNLGPDPRHVARGTTVILGQPRVHDSCGYFEVL